MNKKFNIGNLIAIIFLIGVVSSFFSSDFQLGKFIKSMEFNGVEATLDTINIGLGFVVFVVLLFFVLFQIGRRETGGGEEQGDRLIQDWEKNRD